MVGCVREAISGGWLVSLKGNSYPENDCYEWSDESTVLGMKNLLDENDDENHSVRLPF